MSELRSKCCGVKAFTPEQWIRCEGTRGKTDEYVCSGCGSSCEVEEKEEDEEKNE